MTTRKGLLLQLLEESGEKGVTTAQILQAGVGSRYGARVMELRNEGYEITAERLRDSSWLYRLIRPEPKCACGCGEPAHVSPRYGVSEYALGHQRRKEARYEVDENGCWIWQGGKTKAGYGMLMRDGEATYAHRYFYALHKESIPEGLSLDHLCRNRACVNPDHLEPVTHAENVRRGNSSKLTREIVLAIRSSDEAPRVLATRYGVKPSTITQLRNRNEPNWADCWPDDLRAGRPNNAGPSLPASAGVRPTPAKENGLPSLARSAGPGALVWIADYRGPVPVHVNPPMEEAA